MSVLELRLKLLQEQDLGFANLVVPGVLELGVFRTIVDKSLRAVGTGGDDTDALKLASVRKEHQDPGVIRIFGQSVPKGGKFRHPVFYVRGTRTVRLSPSRRGPLLAPSCSPARCRRRAHSG